MVMSMGAGAMYITISELGRRDTLEDTLRTSEGDAPER
jgi:hypothetical protein